MIKKFIILTFISLNLISILFSQEKDMFKGYKANMIHPNIKEYPEVIQSLDRIKAEYYNNRYKYPDYKMTNMELKKYANAFISSYMYHSKSPHKGYIEKYFRESYPIGGEMLNNFTKLGFPYNLLIMNKGIILGEILDDKMLPKMKTPYPPPPIKIYEYVATVKILEDIFDSFEGDTIYIRHDKSLLEDYSNHLNSLLLFTFKSGGTIQRADSVQYIHLTGKPLEFMFVKNNNIYNPNNIHGINPIPYLEFKQALTDFIINEDIKK